MGTFLEIATDKNEDGQDTLVAIFKGCVIHIGVSSEQDLMKASSRFQKHHLNYSAAVPKSECWRAINAFVKAQGEIRSGAKTMNDFPKAESFESLWKYNVK
jgi:hypothetical protein